MLGMHAPATSSEPSALPSPPPPTWGFAPPPPPADWPQHLWRSLAVVAAVLLGAGLIFWIAAQWPGQTRSFKLHVLQAALALPVLVAVALPRVRVAALLLATLALGGLLAFVGQAYQTGADTWELFATWAALALVWTVVARSDGLWGLWLLIAAAGMAFWSGIDSLQALLLHWGPVQRYGSTVLLWLPVWLLPLCLPHGRALAVARPTISRVAGAALALAAWTGYGLLGVWGGFLSAGGAWDLYAAAVVLVALVVWQAWRWRNVAVLALGLLAGNALWLAGVGRLLSVYAEETVGSLSLLSLLMMASVGGSAHWLFRLQKEGAV